jgi:predicted phage tail protein
MDLCGPSIQVLDPTNGTKVKAGDMVVRWASSDAISGVAGHKVRLDGGDWNDVGNASHFELLGLTEGQHTLEVMAIDEAGNENTSTVNFSVEGKWSSSLIITMVAMLIALALVSVLYIMYRRRRT